MASQRITVHRVHGARLTDDVFEITLKTGETVVWNVTKLNASARAGLFGSVRYAPVADLPPSDWSTWDSHDRATVDHIKTDPVLLEAPAIAIASPNPEFALLCFADGQHRITARQELGLAEFAFYVVPTIMERAYRVEGLTP